VHWDKTSVWEAPHKQIKESAFMSISIQIGSQHKMKKKNKVMIKGKE
jgi:hypothetical protein